MIILNPYTVKSLLIVGSNFRGFHGSLKLRILKSNEIQFFHRQLPVVFKTTTTRTHGSLHFVETTKIGVSE